MLTSPWFEKAFQIIKNGTIPVKVKKSKVYFYPEIRMDGVRIYEDEVRISTVFLQ